MARGGGEVDFRILGRLEALHDGHDVAPRRAQARSLLAVFLLHPNERLSGDRLIEALWGDDPPATAGKALQGHISTLRKLLGPSRITTERGGYQLMVGPGELDRDRFMAELSSARASDDPRDRARQLSEALAMWRGDALADVSTERLAGPEVARLEELRLTALEERAEAELAAGHHAELIPELANLVERHPLSEGLRASLMLALYRGGRQSEALRVYREGRRLLSEELGIDPGSELQLLERRILQQDATLAAPAALRSRSPLPRQERKTVTLMVVEIAAAVPMDPEDLARRVDPVVDRVRAVVERHGGTAEPLFANGILGIFGAPRAHDDDALRAVRTALELGSAPLDDTMSLRGGIETGTALVTIDEGRASVTGEVLGTASRLQLAAALGSILVGQATHRLTEATIEFEPTGPAMWVPVGLRDASPAPLPEAPFVGRADELALLERLFARVTDERSVQLVTIMAEPGGGKSRLLRELRSTLAGSTTPPRWLQGTCLPYGDGVTYWALGEIVKGHAGVLESDDTEATAAKIAAAVRDLEPDGNRQAWLERSLRALVGIERSPASGDREQAFAAWRQFLEAIAGQAPVVVAVEDIHWADEALLGFVDHLVSRATGVPLMVVCTTRLELLETHPGWAGGKRNATTIALEPLSAVETEELLRALLRDIPTRETVKRAGGNPLFAHELARAIETSPSLGSAAVPESLQAVIAARLDALPPGLKAAASDAAVVGEVFWPGAVASMSEVDEGEVESRLLRLAAHDVTRRRRPSSVAQQDEYTFLHVLVRDVAYWQIPRRDRIAKHRAVGAWIERLAGDRVANHAELIAHHYVQALDIARGLGEVGDVEELLPLARTFLALAGEAARTVDLTQAEAFYRRALDLASVEDPSHGRLLSRLGEVVELTGRLSEGEHLIERALVDLRAHDDVLGAGEALINLAAILWRLGRPEAQRRRVISEAVRTLERLPPGPALVAAYAWMAAHELHAGRARACGEWSGRAVALADRLGVLALKVLPLHHLGIARFESGDEAGIGDIREAVRIGLEAGLTTETGTAHSDLAATIWVTEGPVAALAEKHAAADFASSRGLISLEKTIRAESLWQQFDAGLWDEALRSADALIEREGEAASSRVATMARTVKARILAERGRTDEAIDLERVYLVRARELRDPQDLGPALAAATARHQAQRDFNGAAALVVEFERVTRRRDPSQRVHELPQAARICLAAGATALLETLIPSRGAPTYRRARLCLSAARATLAEAHSEFAAAADLHAATAEGWRAFGCPAEAAHSLIGRGRSLLQLGRRDEAARSLREARRIGRTLGAVMIITEADRLVAADRPGDEPTPIGA